MSLIWAQTVWFSDRLITDQRQEFLKCLNCRVLSSIHLQLGVVWQKSEFPFIVGAFFLSVFIFFFCCCKNMKCISWKIELPVIKLKWHSAGGDVKDSLWWTTRGITRATVIKFHTTLIHYCFPGDRWPINPRCCWRVHS